MARAIRSVKSATASFTAWMALMNSIVRALQTVRHERHSVSLRSRNNRRIVHTDQQTIVALLGTFLHLIDCVELGVYLCRWSSSIDRRCASSHRHMDCLRAVHQSNQWSFGVTQRCDGQCLLKPTHVMFTRMDLSVRRNAAVFHRG